MPVFEVTAPDGKVFEVNTPEGGTEQDAIRYLASTYTPQIPVEAPDEGFLRQAADIPVAFARGAVQGVRFIADAFGADNPISQKLQGAEEYLGRLMSAQSKRDAEEISRIMAEAEDKGVLDQVLAGLEALTVAPVDLVSQAFGTAAPALLGGLAGMGIRTAAVVSGGMGAGITKSSIYEATKNELIKVGMPEEEAEARAQLAQQYNGENLDQILLGTGLGALSGFTGIERAILPSVVRNITTKAAQKSAVARAGQVALGEAVPEFFQAGQEQVAANIALQREGFDVPTFQGALPQATLEGLVGGLLGAGVGAVSPARPEAAAPPPAAPAAPATPPAPSVGFEETPVGPPAPETQVPIPGIQAAPTGITAADFMTPEQVRLQRQQQAAQQFGLFPPQPEAAPPAAPVDFEQQRLQRQQAAAEQFPELGTPLGVTAPSGEVSLAPVTPSQVPLRQPTTVPQGEAGRAQIEAINAQAQDRAATIARLRQQAEEDPTERGRQIARETLGQMLRTPAQPRFVDLQPMSLPQATGRLNALKSESPSADLNVVAHPSIPNAFAIEERPIAPQEPETEVVPSFAERRQQGVEAQQRLEAAEMAGRPRAPEEEARQVILNRALQNIEERGGVASPAEAQLIQEANIGIPYDRIDYGLAPQGTTDQRLTEATGIALQPRPREAVTEPARQERQQLEDLIAETSQPAPLPEPNRVIEALRTPPAARTTDQVSAVNLARSRYTPSDIAVLERAADGTMTGADASRLDTIEQMGARFSLSNEVSPQLKAIADDVRKKLLPALKRFGLGNVALRLLDTIDGGRANGSYLKQVISIALDSDNPMGVMRHEVIHALKELGAFTDAEWKALSKRAREEWINRFIGPDLVNRYREVYAEQNNGNMEGFQEYIEEEGIAEAFKHFEDTKPPAGMIANLMRRLKSMFQAIKEFFGAQGLTAEDIFLSDQIFRDIEAGRLQPGRAPQRGATAPVFSLRDLPPVIKKAAEEVGLTEQELLATSLPLQTGGRGDDTFNVDKVGGLTETIGFLEDRRLDSGVPVLDVMNDEDHDQIAKLITAEAMAAIRAGGDALDWYDGVIQRTLNMASLKHPELATDINAGTAFKVAMAITSQGLNVEDNIKLADRIYTQYKRTGKFPEMGSGESEAVMKNSFRRANDMIAEMGFDDFRTFLETPFTVRELQKATGLKISGEMLDETVLGSSIFGPKIGFGFYSNLNGNFDPVTMDMWFMRTIGRLTGKLRAFDETKVGKQIDRFVAAMDERGTDGIYADQFDKDLIRRAKKDREAAMELAKIVNRAHEKDFKVNRDQYNNKTRKKSDLVNAAGAILKSLEKPIDAPTSGGQRRKLRAIFAKVRDNVKQLYGRDVPSASLQAVIWYPEQSLYKSLGVKLRVTNQDYAGAMRKILQEEGYDAERISTAAELGSRGVQSGVQEPVSPAGESRVETIGRAPAVKAAKPKGAPRFSLRPDKVAFRPSDSGGAGIAFNDIKPDAKTYIGSHYGNTQVNTLSGRMYGTGLKGAEANRLGQSRDSRIRNRVYFYIPRFNDTMPPRESGTGNFVYSQKFSNILGPGETMSRLYQEAGGDANAFESSIIDAGYDGYAVPDYGMMVILNNDVPVNFEGTVAELVERAEQPAKPRFSLRVPPKAVTKTPEFKQWFRTSKIVDSDGDPDLWYHGTARDIEEFRAKQAGAIFITKDPKFAETFGDMSESFMAKEYYDNLNDDGKKKFVQEVLDTELKVLKQQLKDKEVDRKYFGGHKAMIELWEGRFSREGYPKTFSEIPSFLEVTATDLAKDRIPSRSNIMPLYVRAEKPFDYANPDHINEITADLYPEEVEQIRMGSWRMIEQPHVQKAIRDAGFDAFYVLEAGRKNLAVYNPNQIKSAIGNIGTFDDTGRIRYNLVAKPENAPPQLLTKTTPVQSAAKAVQTAVKDTFDTIQDNQYWTDKRINWVDQDSGLTKALKDLPLYEPNGTLRADMLKHAQRQVLNLIRTGLGSGIPFLNRDGTISIERSENNFARSEYLADALNTNPNVVAAGVSGKQYVAEIARALRGKDIIEEDKRLNALGIQQLEEAKRLYKEAKQAGKDGNFKRSRALLRQVARLRKEGYKNKSMKRELQVTPEQIKWAEEQLQKTPQVQEILDIWKNINNSLIDLWQEVGLLSAETAQEYRDAKNYVPLFKSQEDLNTEKTFALAGVGAKTTSKLKKLQGSEAIRNIWENLDRQYATMIAAAYENQTRRISVQQLEGLGAAQRTNISDPRGNLKFKENGQDVNVIVENPNVQVAFQTFSYEMGTVMRFFGAFTRVLRAGALINPMFWLRQLIRDPIHATLVANSGVVMPFHSAGNFIQELAKGSPEGRLLAERGVIGQMDSTVDMNEFLTEAGRDRMKKPSVMQKALHKLLQVHEASDAATRIAVFKRAKAKALKDGMSEEQATDFAVFKARESINFSVKGVHPFLNSLRQMIPFLNATIVGLDTLYRAAFGYGLNAEEKKEAQRQFLIKAGVMTGLSLAYAVMYANDDDYNKLPDYVKDNNFLIPIGTGENSDFIKLAIPYEVGYLFKTLPELLVRYLAGNSTGKEVLLSFWRGLIHNLPTGGTLVPQAALPAAEVRANYSFFTGRPIEGMSDQGLPTAMRGDKASEFAKMMSRLGLDKLNLSPAELDHLIQGYFAEAGLFTTEVASSLLSYGQGKNPPEKNLYEMPFFRSFMTNPNSDRAVANFYEITKTAQEVSRAFNDMVKLGKGEEARAYLETDENRMLIGAASTMRKIQDNMAEIRQQIRIVRESQNMSPEQKNEITKRLQDQFNSLANQGVQIADRLGIR